MKMIGLIGGMSWESSAEYYRIINETVRERLGGLHSARIILYSIEFMEIEELQRAGKWDEATDKIIKAAKVIERAGAEVVLICSNTGNESADRVVASIGVPLLNIVDVTAHEAVSRGIGKVGLIGTRYTMEMEFFRKRLEENHGMRVIVPDEEDRAVINDIIYDELCLGITRDESRRKYLDIIGRLVDRGAEGVILGCTEIRLLVGQGDCETPLFDTTEIHARASVDFALGD